MALPLPFFNVYMLCINRINILGQDVLLTAMYLNI